MAIKDMIGQKFGKRDCRIYRIWAHIKDRCCNKNRHAYKRYSGRGIIICSAWKDNFQTLELEG